MNKVTLLLLNPIYIGKSIQIQNKFKIWNEPRLQSDEVENLTYDEALK